MMPKADALSNKYIYCTDIPSNADLNDYYNVGEYRASNASTSASLSNNPYTGSGFKLYVVQTSSAHHEMQIIIGLRAIFIRSGFSTSGTWEWYNWKKLYDYAS